MVSVGLCAFTIVCIVILCIVMDSKKNVPFPFSPMVVQMAGPYIGGCHIMLSESNLRFHVWDRQPNARYPTSAPEMGTDADRLRVSRAAGGRPERGGGPRESRHAGAAALAPLGRCARLGHCGFASYDCVTHKSDTLLDHLLLHFEIRIQISV